MFLFFVVEEKIKGKDQYFMYKVILDYKFDLFIEQCLCQDDLIMFLRLDGKVFI